MNLCNFFRIISLTFAIATSCAAQNIYTVAGTGVSGFSGDGGPAISAELYGPYGMEFDAAGNLYFADYYNNRIRKVSVAGVITTVAGDSTQGFGGDGGPATSAQLNGPRDVAFDAAGNLYIADEGNNKKRHAPQVHETGEIIRLLSSINLIEAAAVITITK